MVNFLNKFKQDAQNSIPGFIAVSITEVATGVCYISSSDKEGFDPEVASVYNLEVAKAKMRAIKALGLKGKIQDILITLTDQIHIIDLAKNGEYFIYLALDRTNSDLDITRGLLKKFRESIADEFDFEMYMRQIATTGTAGVC